MHLQKEDKTVLSNFTYLSILNGLDILLPLLIIPYLTHVVGASRYGDYIFVLTLVQNINTISAYGYNYSATKKISQNRHNHRYIKELYSAIIGGRFLLAFITTAILLIFSLIIFKNHGQFFIFLTSLGIIFGDVFIPSWLFQGMEKMKYMTIVNATAKILFTVSLFFCIKQQSDYVYILLIYSFGFIIAAALSQLLAWQQFKVHIQIPSYKLVIKELRDGFIIFSTTIGMSLYRNLNIIILNYFVSSAAVAVYSIAEKIIKACQSLINPISQALYPRLGYKFKNCDILDNIKTIWKISLAICCLLLIATVIIFFCSDLIPLLFGEEFTNSLELTKLMLPVFFFGCMNYVLGFAGLVNINQQRYFFGAVFASGTVAIITILLMARHIGIYAGVLAMNISEIVLFSLCIIKFIKLYKNNVKLSSI